MSSTDFLSDYIFSGMDTEGMTDNNTEILRFIFEDDILESPFGTVKIESHAVENSGSRWKIALPEFPHFSEEQKVWSNEEKRASLIYAMKDSLKMPTISFAMTYCPTIKVDTKGSILFTLVAETVLGLTDIDWALTLVALGLGIVDPKIVYAIGKPVWNKLRGSDVLYEYNNQAEKLAKIMAELMTNLTMKFHDFFPELLEDAKDPNYTSLYYKALCDIYGRN